MTTGARAMGSADGAWPAGWLAGACLAVLSLAVWQRQPGWAPLLAAAAGLGVAIGTTPRLRSPRAWGGLAILSLLVAVIDAAIDTRTLRAIDRAWESYSASERAARAELVATRIRELADALDRAARRTVSDTALLQSLRAAPTQGPATGGPGGPERVTILVPPSVSGGVETGLVLFDDGRLRGRGGQARVPLTVGDTGVVLAQSAFHTALVARATSADGRAQAVAVALLASAPPADRFARSLTASLAGRIDQAHLRIDGMDSVQVVPGATERIVRREGIGIARVRALPFLPGETRQAVLQRALVRTGVPLAVASLLALVVAWRRPARLVHRLASAIAAVAIVAVLPLTALSNVSTLFDPSSYFAPMGGPLTANVVALLCTTALVLAVLFHVLRATRLSASRRVAALLVLLAAGIGPFLLRDLARGIALPASGAGTGLWIAWQLAIALAGASILLAGTAAGQAALGRQRGIPPSIAPAIALSAALVAPILWQDGGGWPGWFPLPWAVAIGALALTRRGAALVIGTAVVAGAGAVTLTWGGTVRARMALAAGDLARVGAIDENALRLLERFALDIAGDSTRVGAADVLLRRYAGSELAQAGYPARLARWFPFQPSSPVVDVALVAFRDSVGAQAAIAGMARSGGVPEIRSVEEGPSTILVAAIPATDGSVTTVAVPPRTRLLSADPFSLLTGVAGERAGVAPPYRLALGSPGDADRAPGDAMSGGTLRWRRIGSTMHGDAAIGTGVDARPVHVQVDLRGLDALVPRGALLILLDVALIALLWASSAMADGSLGRWLRLRRDRWSRSYRIRLSLTLFGFFLAPAALFAGWASYRLRDDDRAARELLVREALRVAATAPTQRALPAIPGSLELRQLSAASTEAGSPLFLYREAQLVQASDPLLDALAPLGRLLPSTLPDRDLFDDGDQFTAARVPVRGRDALVGYRRVPEFDGASVLAAPARGDEVDLDARREDLGVLLLFLGAMGALAALWSSGVAARALARPVGTLREAAIAIARGADAPALGSAPASEFAPVYRAFAAMATDLAASRSALEAAQRRTEAVLQHVASGVLAIRPDGTVPIANPRALQLLDLRAPGDRPSLTLDDLPAAADPLRRRIGAFMAGADEEDAFDLSLRGRQLRARLTRLPVGAVLTLDDVTELASAERVLAWGEMARQVAHEIKNPLTPIRLGVQHLRRAFRDGRGNFGDVLETNVQRVLEEIDHLDEIARSFSRYGTAPTDRPPPVAVDATAIVRDVLALERLGDDGVEWRLEVDGAPPPVLAEPDALREVVLNLLENARLAQARRVSARLAAGDGIVHLEVSDDGVGIAPEVLPRVFEPHFSTRTSGSGLGLAISRRLIEAWGGTIRIESDMGRGSTVHITMRSAATGRAAASPAGVVDRVS